MRLLLLFASTSSNNKRHTRLGIQGKEGFAFRAYIPALKREVLRANPIKYSLTLHAPDGTRLMGFDNANAAPPVGSRYKHTGKKYPYDHHHRHAKDEGVLYEFDTGYQLLTDFFTEVDRVLQGESS